MIAITAVSGAALVASGTPPSDSAKSCQFLRRPPRRGQPELPQRPPQGQDDLERDRPSSLSAPVAAALVPGCFGILPLRLRTAVARR